MKLGRNVIAGVASSAWTALLAVAVVPVYLEYLGMEAYGLIGFFAMTQSLFQLLDMGLAPTVNREVARCSAAGKQLEARKLLHTLAVIYWSVAAAIALIMVGLASPIAHFWLTSKSVSHETLMHAVMLMGLVIACRWPIGLYQATLNGMHLLTVSSLVNIVMTTLASLGAVAVLAFVSPTIEAFFIWQACVGMLYAATIRWSAWRAIGRRDKHLRFEVQELKRIWRFTAGMSGIALSAIVFTQLDKVLLSKIVGLEEFGHYVLATAVASVLYVLITPIFNVVYPRFSALVATGDTTKLIELYRVGTRLLATFIFPAAMVLAVFARELVILWTNDRAVAESVAPIIAFLTLGTALHGMMFFPFALQLAHGLPRLALKINMILMVILVPLLVFLARAYGALGGAMAWFALHSLYVVLGTWMTHRKLLVGIGRKWLGQDVGIPLLISLLVALIGHYSIQQTDYSAIAKLLCGGTVAMLAVLLSLATSLRTYLVLWNTFRWKSRPG